MSFGAARKEGLKSLRPPWLEEEKAGFPAEQCVEAAAQREGSGLVLEPVGRGGKATGWERDPGSSFRPCRPTSHPLIAISISFQARGVGRVLGHFLCWFCSSESQAVLLLSSRPGLKGASSV